MVCTCSGDGFSDYGSTVGLCLLRFAAQAPALCADPATIGHHAAVVHGALETGLRHRQGPAGSTLPRPRIDAAAAVDRFLEVPTGATNTASSGADATLGWLRSSLEEAASMLTRGGYGVHEVEEMFSSSAVGEVIVVALAVDRCCGDLKRRGWAMEEVVEMLGALLGPRKPRRVVAALPPNLAARVGRLAEAWPRSAGAKTERSR